MSTVSREVTVMVPSTETRQGTRQVCHMVPVTHKQTVCVDNGSWQQVTQTYNVGGCCGCPQTCTRVCNVWVPKIEQKEVECTVMQPTMEQVPYEYTVTVCKPETRTVECQVCNMVPEEQKRTVEYTVCVPQKKTIQKQVVECNMVSEQKTDTYTVQVPYTVQKEITVPVCKMVEKKITCQVPVTTCTPCAPAAPCTTNYTPGCSRCCW